MVGRSTGPDRSASYELLCIEASNDVVLNMPGHTFPSSRIERRVAAVSLLEASSPNWIVGALQLTIRGAISARDRGV